MLLTAHVELLAEMPGYAFAIVKDDNGEFFGAIRFNGALSFPQILTIEEAQTVVDNFNNNFNTPESL